MKPYQLIVFDWDGTLMDSTADIVSCMKQAITHLNLPELRDAQIRHIIGLGLNEAAQTLYPDLDSHTVMQLANEYRRIWLTMSHQATLFEHAFELVRELNQRDLFLGIATGKSRSGLDKVLQATQLAPYFHASRCADECHSKPHPQMLEELIDFMGVTPQETLMIGDTAFDLQMAHNAGADSLAVTHGAHPPDALAACQPRAIVNNLAQVRQWLNTA